MRAAARFATMRRCCPPPPRSPTSPTPAPPPAAAISSSAVARSTSLNGVTIATAYALLFTHQQLVHLFGTIACLAYIADRVRIHYPEAVERVPWLNRLFFRAEERLKESAMIPYAIAVLLTILTFPKPIAMIAIYTLAIADPLAAVVGIRWGRREIVPDRSVEGMAAFFVASLAVAATVLALTTTAPWTSVAGVAILIAVAASLFELVPLRIDDNLTIPLFVGFTSWILCAVFGVAMA